MEQLIIEILKVVGGIIAGIFAIIGYFIKDAYQTLKQNKTDMELRVEKAENAAKETTIELERKIEKAEAQSLAHHAEVKTMLEHEERRRTEMVDRVTSLVNSMKGELRSDIAQLRTDISRFLTPNFQSTDTSNKHT